MQGKKRAASLPVAVSTADNTTLFFFFSTLVVGKSVHRRIGRISKTKSSSLMQEKHEDDGAHWIISFK